MSYDHLPAHLKPCFLYIGVFEEDSRIHVSYITRLWVAEGFIKPKGSRVLEDIAEDYLKDLSDRNLVLGVERRFSGEIKSFRIHDLLRDLCIKVSEQQDFFHVRKFGEIQGTDRRLVCRPHERLFRTAVLLRSSLGERYISAEYFECKLLRVLVSCTEDEFTPAERVYENVNLRYLDHELSTASVHVLDFSTSASLLWNLQTLTIRLEGGSNRLVYANAGIWKMRQLRHVKCLSVYLCDPPPPRDEQDYMDNLQTLEGAVNRRLSEELCQIIPNIKKLSFVFDCHEHGYDDSLIECLHNLERLHKLESLYMDIGCSEWPCQGSEIAFPLTLKKLGLSSCKLSWEDMSIIGSLPQLQVLRLNFYDITVGKQWSPISGQFLSLKLLEIIYCHLVSWDADKSHFPVLEKLVLIGWPYLEGIPLEIGEIPTLGLIHVERCSESAAISAVRIKKDELENHDNEALLIEVVVFESNLESFKKRVEAEELALDRSF